MKKIINVTLLCAFALTAFACSGKNDGDRDPRGEKRNDRYYKRPKCKRCPKCLTVLEEKQSNVVAAEQSAK